MDFFRSILGTNPEPEGVLSSASASASASAAYITPRGAKKREMNNLRAEEAEVLPTTESYEDFKLRILNLVINAGDSYKDLTPGFTAEGKETEEDTVSITGSSIATTEAKKKKKTRLALNAEQKKDIFDDLLVYVFDLRHEVATKTSRTDPYSSEKDKLKQKIITFLYKEGFPNYARGEKKKPINDTNNVTTSIKNYIEENYFQCPKGRNFKYNLHMSEDDKQKIPYLGQSINIIYDAAGVLPHSIFLPGSYKIIYTPGSYIDPGTEITNSAEIPYIEKRIGIVPEALKGEDVEEKLGEEILRKYGLSDIVSNIQINYDPTKPEFIKFSFTINTMSGSDIIKEEKTLSHTPTVITSTFNFPSVPSSEINGPSDATQLFEYLGKNPAIKMDSFIKYTYHPKDISGQEKTYEEVSERAREYFKGNGNKNKFIYDIHEYFNVLDISDGKIILNKDNKMSIINNDKSTKIITNEYIKYIIMKELGDTLQVMWLDKITKDSRFIGANNQAITKENTFVMTGDAMLIARCILNGYNCIYLSGASSTFYLSNFSMETLPLLSEKLPELEPNPEDVVRKRERTPSAAVRATPRTPGAAVIAAQSMVVDEPRLDFEEDPNPALNAYLVHNYDVINSLIEKGNAGTTIQKKNIWFYFAAYLKHNTDVMHEALKASGADAETIGKFYLNGLKEEEENIKKSFNSFLNINRQVNPIDIPNEPKPLYNEEKTKNYQCFTNGYDVLLRVEERITTTYYYGTYDELFNRITNHMIDKEKKGKFYIKYYNPIIYPTELVTDINKIGTIIKAFNDYNPLYKTNMVEITSILYGVGYFLHKLQTESPDADISIEKTMIGDRHCYFEKEEEAVTGMAKRVRRQSVFSPQGKQGGGAFQYNERPADYELETYKPYFANPGYATFYALSRFPRVFLMGYSIMRFLREVLQAQTNEINTLFKFCGDALDPELSKLLTEVFLHADEPNYHYNVDSHVELEKQMERLAELDSFMYYTIEVVRAVSVATGLFAPGNDNLMKTISEMLTGHREVSGIVIPPELEKVIHEKPIIFVDVVTEFFRALIQNYNDLADIGKADVVNSISCYEHKIKNAVMSGVDEIMVPLEILIQRKKEEEVEKSEIEMTGPSDMVMPAPMPAPMPVASATAMENGVKKVVTPTASATAITNDMNMSNGVSTPPRILKREDTARYWGVNMNKVIKRIQSSQKETPKMKPRVMNTSISSHGYSRRKSDIGRRPRYVRALTPTPKEVLRAIPEEMHNDMKNLGGGHRKTKKRIALKPKRTRRKARKQ